MKKILLSLMMVFAIALTAVAQQTVRKEDKVKHTSTVPQKVHNTFSKHKHYSGYKVKHKRKVKYAKKHKE